MTALYSVKPSKTYILPYEHELVKVNGVMLHVVTAGPVDGEMVLLLHGFPEFWYGWRGQIDALANAGYRVIVPDQRGYNLSDKPADVREYAADYLANDAAGLIRHYGHESAYVIGHDWGAIVAWWLTLANSKRVKKLGILNVPHPYIFNKFLRSDFQQLLKSWYGFMFQIPWLPETVWGIGGYDLGARMIQATAKSTTFSETDIQRYREAWAQPNAMRSMINWYRAAVRYMPDSPESWWVNVPTLMIWGQEDFALSSKMATASIDLCKRGRLVMIPDATHWVQHDAKDQVNSLLLDFLRE